MMERDWVEEWEEELKECGFTDEEIAWWIEQIGQNGEIVVDMLVWDAMRCSNECSEI